MIVEYSHDKKEQLASELNIGDTFTYKGELHVKIEPGSIRVQIKDRFPNLVLNLSENRLNSLSDNAIVTLVKSKIVVEN